MLKEVLGAVDLTVWAEIGLVMFAVIFVVIAIRTLLGDAQTSRRNAHVVLEGGDDD